jgi:hypothetical protein
MANSKNTNSVYQICGLNVMEEIQHNARYTASKQVTTYFQYFLFKRISVTSRFIWRQITSAASIIKLTYTNELSRIWSLISGCEETRKSIKKKRKYSYTFSQTIFTANICLLIIKL